jgi:hypothetical protein
MRAALVEAAMAALPLAIIYFSGWAYLSAYLADFDIDATQIEVSIPTVLVYALVPLLYPRVIVVILLLLAMLLVVTFCHPLVKPATRAAPVIFILSTILLVVTVRSAAKAEADAMATLVWHGKKSITNFVAVAPEKNPDSVYVAYKQCGDARRLRQIIGLSDTMFLLCRNADLPCWHATLFAIKDDGSILYSAERRRDDHATMAECSK